MVPSFEDIATARVTLVAHIPAVAVVAVSAALITLLRRYNRTHTWKSLHALYAFPKAVLGGTKPQRAGPLAEGMPTHGGVGTALYRRGPI